MELKTVRREEIKTLCPICNEPIELYEAHVNEHRAKRKYWCKKCKIYIVVRDSMTREIGWYNE